MSQTWTLLAECSAGCLTDYVRDYLPGSALIASDGAYATVTVLGGKTAPEWMSRLEKENPQIKPVVSTP